MHNKSKTLKVFIGLIVISFTSFAFGTSSVSAVDVDAGRDIEVTEDVGFGGGYAVTNQIDNVGYVCEVYDAANGLPTSDANFVLGASDGYVWIGGYSGIIRYDGTDFERIDSIDGLTSGRGLYEDSLDRIWVATNDNGVVVLNGNESVHYTYTNGLTSLSVRTFAEDSDGNIFIGTTSGIWYVDADMNIYQLDDERINEERIVRFDADKEGKIYGQTGDGMIFSIEDKKISELYTGNDLGLDDITTIMADPNHAGNVYIGTEGETIYYGYFGDTATFLQEISVAPATNIHWINYDCNRVWVSSSDVIGYLDGDEYVVVEDSLLDSAIEMVTSDFQGNIWVASSTQGVMKIVTNNFVDLSSKVGLPQEVTNATHLLNDDIYIGTDNGLYIVSRDGDVIENDLTDYLGGTRIRDIMEDAEGNLWLAVYNNDLGLICYTPSGEIIGYTTDDGLPSNAIRCIVSDDDGNLLVGTNGGLAIIKDGEITRTYGSDEGIKNTVFLTVNRSSDGKIYAGSDGDGIYVIDDDEVSQIGLGDGLTSNVIMRIVPDDVNDVQWLVTSNSIEYIRDGVVSQVESFPYNNNYDIYFDDNHNMWILSSYGVYKVYTQDMLCDTVSDYRIYTIDNGLPFAPTANSHSAMADDGYIYVPGRSGVIVFNINNLMDIKTDIKTAISSIYLGDELIQPDDGEYTIPASDGRITIHASVLDYSLTNPYIRIFFEGNEDDGISELHSELSSLEYTGLKYGDYTLHIQAFDEEGNILVDDSYQIVKKPRLIELMSFRILIFACAAVLIAFIVWRAIKITVIRRQYETIRQAKEEAEQANTAKSRFLANISNEILTPVNTIVGMNEMTMREDPAGVPKEYYHTVTTNSVDIRNAAETLHSIINDLLDISKIESGSIKLVEQEYCIEDVLRQIVSLIRPKSTEKELLFEVEVDENLPVRMYGDIGKIRQIVLNLLTNAVKYTDVGGVYLKVIATEIAKENITLALSVRDTGMGIKDEVRDKLFSAYDHLDEEKNVGIEGMGLGLDISRRFTELIKGNLSFESEYGKGSEFILTVSQKIIDSTPIGTFNEYEESKATERYVPQFIAPDADVLVVDDDPMDLNVITGLLKATKVFVTKAESGAEALDRIKETNFNVVLLDYIMPGMDGIETLERIRMDHPDLPVYVLTTDTTVESDYYISKGFNGILKKPIDSKELERAVMKHLPTEMMAKPSQ